MNKENSPQKFAASTGNSVKAMHLKVSRFVHAIKHTTVAKTSKVNRSAISGKFVTKTYAAKHPKTTVKETVKKGR